jgi:glycosyltransferase involved in cell wall biosynthesis
MAAVTRAFDGAEPAKALDRDMTSAAHGPRACMISFYFPPSYSGSAVQAHNLCRHLQRRNVASFIVAANLEHAASREVMEGISVFRLPVINRAGWQIVSFAVSLSWFLFRQRRHYEVIHAHGAVPHGVASIVGRALRKKTILKIAMANSDIAFPRQGRLAGALNRFLVGRFDRYIATTDAIRQEFHDRRLDSRRVHMIPNGVDTDRCVPLSSAEREVLRAELALPSGPLVCFVGIINRRKNVDGLVRIWERATRAGVAGRLLILGPAPDSILYEELVAFVAKRGLRDRVLFLGHRPDVVRYLQVADVFLFPTRQEGMPNAVLEAMACGLPCLVSRGTGTDAVITDGISGFSREMEDEVGFAEALVRVCRNTDLRERLGGAARQTAVEQFSLEAIAARYAALYRDVLSK